METSLIILTRFQNKTISISIRHYKKVEILFQQNPWGFYVISA